MKTPFRGLSLCGESPFEHRIDILTRDFYIFSGHPDSVVLFQYGAKLFLEFII